MAKDVSNEDDEDKFDKMDDESLGFLEQVKKGKARNFVLSMKGNKVKSLLVKKKPIKDKDRKEARGGGFQPIFGVATGTGLNITFTVARSDGFDDKTAGTKTEKLKKFLKEQTGTAYKPEFALVDTPPAIPFDEDDLKDPLIARFMQMESLIEQACTKSPDSVPQIQSSVNTIRTLLQDEETRPSAAGPMDELEAFLRGILAGETAAPPPPTSAPSEDAATSFKTRLAELLPKIKAAAGTPAGEKAKLKASEAGMLARKQEFAKANALLDEAAGLLHASPGQSDAGRVDARELAAALKKVEPAIKAFVAAHPDRKLEILAPVKIVKQYVDGGSNDAEAASQAMAAVTDLLKQFARDRAGGKPAPLSTAESQQTSSVAPDQAQWTRQFASIEPRYLEVLKRQSSNAGQMRTIMTYATEQAEAGQFQKALVALERLGPLLDEAAGDGAGQETDVIPRGKVAATRAALEQAKVRWDAAVIRVGGEFDKIIAALQADSPELADAVAEVLDDFRGRVDALAELARSILNDEDAQQQRSQAREMISAIRDEVEGDEVLAHLDTFEPASVTICSVFQLAFNDIEKQLA